MWTRFPELDEVLRAFVAGVEEVLGENLVGVYLQGSFAVGDADEQSDVDFVVVTNGPLGHGDPPALQAAQEQIFAMPTPWAQHLEGSYFTRELIGRLDPECTPVLYFDNGQTKYAWDDHCNTAVVRCSVREHGIALAGPDPKDLIPPVTADDLRAEMLVTLRKWDDSLAERSSDWSRRFQGHLVLAMCRILQTLDSGHLTSKRAAGEWALTNLPSEWHDLIRCALDDRSDQWVKLHEQADPTLLARSYAFLDYALSKSRS